MKMNGFRVGILVGFSIAFIDCGNGTTETSSTFDSAHQQLVAGTPDRREKHPSVCTFVGELFPGGPTVAGCTATFIAPNVAVTAAHCSLVFTSNPGLNCDGFVTVESARRAGRFVVHPSYAGNLGTIGQDKDDVAVFLLDEQVEDARVALLPADGRLDLEAEDRVTIVGYGIATPFDPARLFDYLREPKTRRVGQTRVDRITRDYLQLAAAPTVGCFLDSGGPAFVGRGSRHLLGTLQLADCATFGQYVRMDTPSALGFLEPFMAERD